MASRARSLRRALRSRALIAKLDEALSSPAVHRLVDQRLRLDEQPARRHAARLLRAAPRPPTITWATPAAYSRKTQTVTLMGTVLGVKIQISGSPAMIWALRDRLTDASVLALGNALATGIYQVARRVPRSVKRNEVDRIKEIAAAVYLLLGDRAQLAPEAQAAVHMHERRCAAAYKTVWDQNPPFERRKLLTAFLVRELETWQRLKLLDPFTVPENTASSFYRRYVLPKLADVRATLRTKLAKQLFHEGLDSRIRFIVFPSV